LDLVAPAPKALKQIWARAKRNQADKLGMHEIDAEIAEVRRGQKSGKRALKRRR
jgi:hypothetical protein